MAQPSIVNASGAGMNSVAATDTITRAFDCTGADFLRVTVFYRNATNIGVPSSVTFNGDALAAISGAALHGGLICDQWCMANPDQGSFNIIVTLPSAVSELWVGAEAWEDVLAASTLAQTAVAAQSNSVTLPGVTSNDVAVASCGEDFLASGSTLGPQDTALWERFEASSQSTVAAAYQVGSGSVVVNWTSGDTITGMILYGTVAPSSAITGTGGSGMSKADIIAGGKTLIFTLTADTFIASGGAFNAERQNFINGGDSAQAEAAGWDAVVKAGLAVTDLVRTSNTVATLTLPAFASYNITAPEVVTWIIPGSILTGGNPLTCTPTITISPGGAIAAIMNLHRQYRN